MSGRWKAVDAALCRQNLSGPQRRFNFARRARDYQETGTGRHFWNSCAFSQWRSVFTLNPKRPANSCCDMPGLARIALTSIAQQFVDPGL